MGGAYGRQGGIKEVLKLKERKIKVFFFLLKIKVHHLVIRGTHFEQNENNPMKKLYLIHQVQFPDF